MGGKIILKRIENERKRKFCLKRRKLGLLHKLKELWILRGVKAAAIIYSPGEDQPLIWPSRKVLLRRIAEYHWGKEADCTLKTDDQISYLRKMIRKEVQMIRKRMMKEDEEREMMSMINEIMYKGMDVAKLDAEKANALLAFMNRYLEQLEERSEYLRSRQFVVPCPCDVFLPENGFFNRPNFVDGMNVEALNFGGGARMRQDGLLENDEIELPHDLNEIFPRIFA